MLKRNENLKDAIATARIEKAEADYRKALLSLGKVLKAHRVKAPMIRKEVISCNLEDLKSLINEYYNAPWYCTNKQYRLCKNIKETLNLNVNVDEFTVADASKFIQDNSEAMRRHQPISDAQLELLTKMKPAAGLCAIPDFDITSMKYVEAYEFIGKYRKVFREFQYNLPYANQIEKAEKLCGGIKWDLDTIYQFTKTTIVKYIELLEIENAGNKTKTSLVERQDTSRSVDNEDPEKREKIMLSTLMIAIYNHMNLEFDSAIDMPQSVDEIRETVKWCHNEIGNVPFAPFRTALKNRLFEDEEVQYILDLSDEQFVKYFN